MKTFNYIIFFLALPFLYSCDNHKEATRDILYFTGTENSATLRYSVEGATDIGVSIRSSTKVTENVKVEIGVNNDLVEAYNKKHNTSYKLLPEGSFALSENRTTIPVGEYISKAIMFSIGQTSEMVDEDTYLAPIQIMGVEGGSYPLLESRSVMYLVINKTIITQAPYFGNRFFKVDFNSNPDMNLSTLPEVTFEARIYMEGVNNRHPYISTIIGLEEHFLLRCGDVENIERDQIQIAGMTPVTAPQSIPLNRWTHVAATYNGATASIYIDGKLQISTDGKGETINLNGVDELRTFYIGETGGHGSGGRYFDGYMSEVRVWNRALSAGELQAGMCAVSPDSPGLVAYWRMSDDQPNPNGKGTVVPDYTGNGFHAVAISPTAQRWMEGVRCP